MKQQIKPLIEQRWTGSSLLISHFPRKKSNEWFVIKKPIISAAKNLAYVSFLLAGSLWPTYKTMNIRAITHATVIIQLVDINSIVYLFISESVISNLFEIA